jgi:DNA-directed RNA polymerase subunit RPC12/RpoP
MGFLDNLPDLGLPKGRPPSGGRPKPEIDCVEWRSVHCPKCGSADCPVIDSHTVPVRRHRCKMCGHEFRSIEKNYRPTPGAGD